MPRTILTYHLTKMGLARCLWDLNKTIEFVGQKVFDLVLVAAAVAVVVVAAVADVVAEVVTAVVIGQEGLLGKGRV